jgi:hypothetical protein
MKKLLAGLVVAGLMAASAPAQAHQSRQFRIWVTSTSIVDPNPNRPTVAVTLRVKWNVGPEKTWFRAVEAYSVTYVNDADPTLTTTKQWGWRGKVWVRGRGTRGPTVTVELPSDTDMTGWSVQSVTARVVHTHLLRR